MKLFKFYLTVLLTLFSIALFSQNEISACTDALACNYNNLATIDDGSCVYPESLNYSFLYNKQGWSGAGGCLVTHDDVEDAVLMTVSGNSPVMRSPQNLALNAAEFGSVTVTLKNMSSVSNGFKLQYVQGVSTSIGDITIPVGSNMTDYETITVSLQSLVGLGTIDRLGFKGPFQAETGDSIYFKSIVLNKYNDCGVCNVDLDNDGVCDNNEVLGCTDSTASNYDDSATEENGSCEYIISDDPCDYVPTGLSVDNIIHNRVTFNWATPIVAPSHYMIRYRPVGSNSWTVMTAGTINTNPFTGTSRTRWWMEAGTTYQWNIRARVLEEDGSVNCQSAWSAPSQFTTLDACPNLENLSVSTEAIWATFGADAPDSANILRSRGKLREIGTNSYRYVFGDSDGNINSTKGNFDPSTDYEWHTKAWCTGNIDSAGNSDPMYTSGWGDFYPFSTQALCDKMPNNFATTANNAQTAITMSWDTPLSGEPDHYFLYLENLGTGDVYAWNDIPGNATSKTKYNLAPGEYSWKIRGACGPDGTSWATPFSTSVMYTLGSAKLEKSSIANLDVYPNPSRNVFNVTFTSEINQIILMKVYNVIYNEVYNYEFLNSSNKFNKEINLSNYSKGMYFLEITTKSETLHKKIILE